MGSKLKLPNGWAYPKARDIFESITDKTHNGKLQVLSATQDKGVIPRDKVDIDIRFSDDALLNYKKVRKGNFVIHLRSFQGGLAYSAIEGIISPAYVVLAPKVEICDDFFRFYFTSKDFIKRLKVAVYGIRDGKQISYDSFGMINILLPPLKEQKKIAEILMAQDKVISLKEKLLEAKKKQKKWLIQNLLTGRIRLNGFKEVWKKEKLGKYLIEYNEKSTRNNQFPVLTSSRRGLFLQSDYYNREVASEDNTGYNVVPYGYFTYRHMSDDNVFVFNINTIVPKGIVSTLYPVFTTKDINDVFLAAILNYGEEFSRFVRTQKQGGSRTYIYFSKLNNLILTIPQFEEQTAIAERLIVADKEIELLAKDLESQKNLKKYLMQQLLTGKIRV